MENGAFKSLSRRCRRRRCRRRRFTHEVDVVDPRVLYVWMSFPYFLTASMENGALKSLSWTRSGLNQTGAGPSLNIFAHKFLDG